MEKIRNALEEAENLIYSERAKQYGKFEDNIDNIIHIFFGMTGIQLTHSECTKFLIALKLARENKNHKRDNIVDAIGYLALFDDLMERK